MKKLCLNLQGLGTDEAVLIEILSSRSSEVGTLVCLILSLHVVEAQSTLCVLVFGSMGEVIKIKNVELAWVQRAGKPFYSGKDSDENLILPYNFNTFTRKRIKKFNDYGKLSRCITKLLELTLK